MLALGVAKIRTKVSGGILIGDGLSSNRTYAAVLTEATGGMKLVFVKQSDLIPMANWSEVVKGGEET